MRLTLRTLLAWLDDKLAPAEVREIGKQVTDSPYAQDLIDRTYRVTRQRRLLVPPTAGADATDPNVVASYLDSELGPDEVVEYEKKCLTSDVNLAEVASVHQILSLIGQRAKVPPEAKHRMYRLIKGRETAALHSSPHAAAAPPASITAPIASWSAPAGPRRSIRERFGFAGLVAGLLVLATWSAYLSLRPDASAARGPRAGLAPAPAPSFPTIVVATPPAPAAAEVPATNEVKPTEAEIARKAADELAKAELAPVRLAEGDGVTLAYDAGKAEWSRLGASATIKDGTRVLNLAPFWSTIRFDPAKVVLIGEAELTTSGKDRTMAVKLDFDRGRAVLKGSAGLPYRVTFAGKSLTITPPPGGAVGLERSWKRPEGTVGPVTAPLLVYVPEGEATLAVGDAKETLKGPATAELTEAGALRRVERPAPPAWVTEAGPPPSEAGLAERYRKVFTGGTVARDLVQAVDGDDPDARRLAVGALGAIGEIAMVIPVINSASYDGATRRASADIFRSMLARGGEPAKAVSAELAQAFGQQWAEPTEKVLLGFSAEEARRESTYAELVRMLSAPDLGTRELALQALMTLTGRDSLEYDPLNPAGRGLRAWQELLNRKENHAEGAAPDADPRALTGGLMTDDG